MTATTTYHWAVEVPDGATTRLIEYQIRERPARIFAKEGGLRLLRRIYRDNGDGSEYWGPWEEVQP